MFWCVKGDFLCDGNSKSTPNLSDSKLNYKIHLEHLKKSVYTKYMVKSQNLIPNKMMWMLIFQHTHCTFPNVFVGHALNNLPIPLVYSRCSNTHPSLAPTFYHPLSPSRSLLSCRLSSPSMPLFNPTGVSCSRMCG